MWAFLGLHVALLAVDRYADVGILGALVPGLSGYRAPAVALGTLAVYALVITAVTARWTKLLPRGAWVSIHRLAAVVFGAAWAGAAAALPDRVRLPAFRAPRPVQRAPTTHAITGASGAG